ncbi:unnamed protein product [Durusdinium trenchii]|uniref:cGMP-dependent protein kinase n=1 Tax=Durusdinium trenchii TaxID=1381693 RepID=A0ABP0I5N6_9DINO
MGHHSSALSRLACGPGVPGEFEFLPYTRLEHDLASSSQESKNRKTALAGKEALLARHQQRLKTRSDCSFLMGALRASSLFKNVGNDHLERLVGSLEYYEFQMGDTIQQEGSMESSYIFVAHGPGLDFVLQGVVVSSLSPGQTFGESSLPQKCPHSFSVLAARKTGVWAAPSQLFREAILASVVQQVSDIRAFLEKVPLLQGLSPRELDCVADMCAIKTYSAGEFPAHAASELNYAFLIKSGQLKRIETPGREEKLLEAGDCVGKRLLLYGDKSGVTIQATQRCELILLNVRRLRQLIGKQDAAIKLQQNKLTSILLSSPVLSAQSESLVADICKSLELSEYLPGAKIPPSIGLFVVLDGEVQAGHRPSMRILRRGHVEAPPAARAAEGGAFDRVLLGSAHDCALMAGHSGSRLAVLPQKLRTDDVADMKARVIAVLSRVSIFRQVQEATLDALFHCVKTQIYRKGDEIVKQGDKGSHFYVIAAGEVDMIKDGHAVRRLVQGGCFGERAVRCEEPWPTSFHMASAEGEVWFWDSSSLLQALGKEIRASEQLRQRALLQDPGVKLRDLHRLGQVGTGTSGTVWLVRHKESGARYALKRMEKVDDNDKVSQEVQREIEILSENDHPFLMHMVKALETLRNVYVLAEYVGGGELYAAMRSINTVFSRQQAMFYAGSILLMVEALHERNVVYRDLKPENILLDEEGYLKLVDFGTAKKLDAKCGRTFTLVGTTHYMAPEVMRGKGYGLEVDVWALGILLYELLCGQLPFGEHAENDREVCRAVLAGKPRIPSSLEDSSQRILVSLLEPRPRRRLGCGANGLQEIKDHGFFRAESHHNGDEANRSHGETEDDFFTPLLSRMLDPPIKPSSKGIPELSEEPLTDQDEEVSPTNGRATWVT